MIAMISMISARLRHALTLTAALSLALCGVAWGQGDKPSTAKTPDDVYATYGVHNDSHSKECADPRTCTYERAPGMPSDPEYPEYWTSHWKMYRVFNRFQLEPAALCRQAAGRSGGGPGL